MASTRVLMLNIVTLIRKATCKMHSKTDGDQREECPNSLEMTSMMIKHNLASRSSVTGQPAMPVKTSNTHMRAPRIIGVLRDIHRYEPAAHRGHNVKELISNLVYTGKSVGLFSVDFKQG
jgi:hypothetical protein